MFSCKLSRFRRYGVRGFSLVELLIVVAIIGVLSTVGVPTFRRMVTRSKKTEAKTGLAGLFTAQSAFFTEYNTYGNHLTKLGFDLEGARRLYVIGYPDSDCNSAKAGDIFPPLTAGGIGDALNQSYGAYYDVTNWDNLAVTDPNYDPGSRYNRSVNAGGPKCLAGTVAETSYTATATGNIAPGVQNSAAVSGTTGPLQDVWTIDQRRNLVNSTDGTN